MSKAPSTYFELNYYDIEASAGFAGWLAARALSVGLTTGEDVFLIGLRPDDTLSIVNTEFDRCTALTAIGTDTLCLATRYQIWYIENAARRGELLQDRFDHLYIPQSAYTTGNLDIHGVCVEDDGRVIFVNTPFNCIAAVDERKNFRPLWLPPWISSISAGDRCHLSGLALRDGYAAYATSMSQSDVLDGWRTQHNGGVVVDLRDNAIVAHGLSMPHTPRWYQDRLWLTNAGAGAVGYIDPDRGSFEQVTFCPGFTRGLAFCGDFAIVGASKPRHGETYSGLELDDILARQGAQAQSGIFVVDLRTGQVVEHLLLRGTRVREVFDIVALPGVRRPSMLQLGSEAIQQNLTVGPA